MTEDEIRAAVREAATLVDTSEKRSRRKTFVIMIGGLTVGTVCERRYNGATEWLAMSLLGLRASMQLDAFPLFEDAKNYAVEDFVALCVKGNLAPVKAAK